MAEGSPGWAGWFVAAVLLPGIAVGATLYVSNQDLRARELVLEQGQAALRQGEQTLETGRQTLSLREQEITIQQQELVNKYKGGLGEGSDVITNVRALFDDPTRSSEERGDALRAFAAALRDLTPAPRPLGSFRTRLPNGAHEMANTLRDLLRERPTKVDLSATDLHGQVWRRGDFQRVLFVASDLRAVDFTGSSLDGATMERASLRCADLSGVDGGSLVLTGADLYRADLRAADLSRVRGLRVDQLVNVAYDDDTDWPPGVDERLLPASASYEGPARCVAAEEPSGPAAPPVGAATATDATPKP